IRITYLALNYRSGLVGVSAGAGVPAGFTPTDLDAAGSCLPSLLVSVPPNATEGDGVLLNSGQIAIPAALSTDLSISLSSSDSSQVSITPAITILAGQTNASFDLNIIDDSLLNGTRLIT